MRSNLYRDLGQMKDFFPAEDVILTAQMREPQRAMAASYVNWLMRVLLVEDLPGVGSVMAEFLRGVPQNAAMRGTKHGCGIEN
jgi:hypothetical protein